MAGDLTEAVRREVASRAFHRCEYCLLHEDDSGFSHQVDHIVSRKHDGLSTLDNLAYACVLCNRRKGTDLGSIDKKSGRLIALFNPRRDRWHDHFRIEGQLIQALSETGEVTIQFLKLNAPERLAERRAFQALDSYPR